MPRSHLNYAFYYMCFFSLYDGRWIVMVSLDSKDYIIIMSFEKHTRYRRKQRHAGTPHVNNNAKR